MSISRFEDNLILRSLWFVPTCCRALIPLVEKVPWSVSTAYKYPTGTRRHTRINVAVPVKITSHDNPLQPAMACTYEVSLKGCKIVNSMGLNTIDQLVWLNRKNRKAVYKVVWTSPKKNQVGLQIAESEKLIWDDELVGKLS